MFLWLKPVSFSLIHFFMCKNLLREPCETEYMCFCSLLWHLNLYSRLSLAFSKRTSFPLRWEGERLVAISYSACQIFCQSYQTGRLAVTLNQNISPILKYLNQILEALSLLASLRNQKVESRVCAQASLLALLFGRRLAPDTDTDMDTDTHPFARTCSLGVGKHAKQKWYKLCNPYVRKA